MSPRSTKEGHVLQLHASLYGLRSSGKNWYNTLRAYLKSQGLRPTRADPCLFVNTDRSMVVAIYVDDLLFSVANRRLADDFIANMNTHKTLSATWKVKNMGRPSHFLGIEINWHRFGVKLTHTKMSSQHAQAIAQGQSQTARFNRLVYWIFGSLHRLHGLRSSYTRHQNQT